MHEVPINNFTRIDFAIRVHCILVCHIRHVHIIHIMSEIQAKVIEFVIRPQLRISPTPQSLLQVMQEHQRVVEDGSTEAKIIERHYPGGWDISSEPNLMQMVYL